MRESWVSALVVVATAMVCAPAVHGQSGDAPGPMVIWVVKPAPPASGTPAIYNHYNEQTTGGFGQTASDTGTASSNVGETSSSLPSRVSSTESSNVGQTAGSFEGSLGSADKATAPTEVDASARWITALSDPEQRWRLPGAQGVSQLSYVVVTADKVPDKLRSSSGTGRFPDLLVGAPLPADVAGPENGDLVQMIIPLEASDLGDLHARDEPYAEWSRHVQFAMPSQARHPAAAKKFIASFGEPIPYPFASFASTDIPDAWKPVMEPLFDLAVNSTDRLISGEQMGSDADMDLARFDPELARLLVLGNQPGGTVEGLKIRTEVLEIGFNPRTATAMLRLTVQEGGTFRVLHPMLVFRKDATERWKLLYGTLSLSPQVYEAVRDSFGREFWITRQSLWALSEHPEAWRHSLKLLAAGKMEPSHLSFPLTDGLAHAKGISQAAPEDGDSRPPTPELWWDNGGGAATQVIEWQRKYDGAWDDSRMYFVKDRNPKLQTRVQARFADQPGWYRWRVWSVGADHDPELSPWRKLLIQ